MKKLFFVFSLFLSVLNFCSDKQMVLRSGKRAAASSSYNSNSSKRVVISPASGSARALSVPEAVFSYYQSFFSALVSGDLDELETMVKDSRHRDAVSILSGLCVTHALGLAIKFGRCNIISSFLNSFPDGKVTYDGVVREAVVMVGSSANTRRGIESFLQHRGKVPDVLSEFTTAYATKQLSEDAADTLEEYGVVKRVVLSDGNCRISWLEDPRA